MSNTPNALPPTWRFSVEDYTALGTTFAKFLQNLNLFTLAAYNLFNGGLGFANLQRAIYRITLTASTTTTLSFVNPLPIAPSGLSVVQVLIPGNTQTPLTDSVSAANWFYDGRNIQILNITGLTSGTTYQLALEVC